MGAARAFTPGAARVYPDRGDRARGPREGGRVAIKIEMLRCFVAVADTGSLAAAAEALGRTPSAVSMMLRQFEDHVGAPLFEAKRKARLTALGELVRAEAQRELAHFDATVSAIEGLANARGGYVRLAVTPSVAQAILPPVLRDFSARHPGVRLDLRDMDSASIRDDLLAGRADIGLATLPILPGFERHLLLSDRFGVVCRADDPLARNGARPAWHDLKGLPFIANGLCKQIEDPAFLPLLAESALNAVNTASILALVRAGMGITLLPELVLRPHHDDLCFVPLAGDCARREIWMVTPPPEAMVPAALSLKQAILRADIPLQDF